MAKIQPPQTTFKPSLRKCEPSFFKCEPYIKFNTLRVGIVLIINLLIKPHIFLIVRGWKCYMREGLVDFRSFVSDNCISLRPYSK